eukprot:861263-Amphidinium_carterae.1
MIYGRKEKVINPTSSKVGHTDLAYKQTLEELEMPIHSGRSSLRTVVVVDSFPMGSIRLGERLSLGWNCAAFAYRNGTPDVVLIMKDSTYSLLKVGGAFFHQAEVHRSCFSKASTAEVYLVFRNKRDNIVATYSDPKTVKETIHGPDVAEKGRCRIAPYFFKKLVQEYQIPGPLCRFLWKP